MGSGRADSFLSTRRGGHLARVSLSSYSYRAVFRRGCVGAERRVTAHIGALGYRRGCHWCVGCSLPPLATAVRGVMTGFTPKSWHGHSRRFSLFVRGVALRRRCRSRRALAPSPLRHRALDGVVSLYCCRCRIAVYRCCTCIAFKLQPPQL